jgi:predicted phosphodiesterase
MAGEDLARDILADLMRSAWVVERARAVVYEDWSPSDPRFEASARRALQRAGILEEALASLDVGPDRGLVEGHADWIRSCAGGPHEAFGDLFVARLADWVDAHVLEYLDRGADRMRALLDEERSSLVWPASLPPPPPFEPLETPRQQPPGELRLRIGVLGDMHIGSPHADALAAAAIADLNAARAGLVVQLGDVTDRGEMHEFEAAAKLLSDVDAPFLPLMGNHDAYSMSEQRLAGRDYFRNTFGRAPDGALIESHGIRIAALDSVDHGVSPFAPFDLVTGSFLEGRGGAVVRGALSSDQHDILAEIAAPGGGPAFVFLHHPPQPFTGFPPVIFGLRDSDSGRIHATCDSGNVWGVFAGHTHRNHRGAFDGVPVQEVAAPRDFPCGYALIDVATGGYSYRFVQISDPDVLGPPYARAGSIHRRYALGAESARAYTWRK